MGLMSFEKALSLWLLRTDTSKTVSIPVGFELAQDAELIAEAEVCCCQVKMATTGETCYRQLSL